MSTRPGSNAALLIVDVQSGVVAHAWDRDRIVANVALSVARARACEVPVIWVQHDDAELLRDSPGWQWVPELAPDPQEMRIFKHFNSAFEETPLLGLLDERGISHLHLAGAATNWCIRATAYAALERGFDLTLIGDAHTTGDIELAPGRVVEARSVVDDLNTAMRWLSYPGRKSAVLETSALKFDVSRPVLSPIAGGA